MVLRATPEQALQIAHQALLFQVQPAFQSTWHSALDRSSDCDPTRMRTSRTARSTVILQHGMRLDHARRRTGPQAFAVVAQKPFACASTVNVRPSSAVWRRFATSRGLSRSSPRLCVTPAPESIKISTFNMLCPAYRRLDGHPDDVRESSFPHVYLPRHQQILRLHELWSSDIVCCQEFWYASQDLFNLYVRTLQSKYRMHGVQRPARDGSKRPDGLFMCISREWQVLHEADIDFADAAGRCAQVLHLRRSSGDRPMEVIVANVHLLFPHNAASGRIRVREAHKLLEYIDVYKRSLERPPPTVVCGDLNGDRVSVVRRHFSRLGCAATRGAS